MRPGVIYSAPALAARFGVSPTPVRAAMLELAGEGLVTVVRNKGFRAVELSERELDEITEVRGLIEVPAIGRIAATPHGAAPLRPLAEAIVTAAEERDVLRYIAADEEFHLALLSLGGNTRLVDAVRELRNRSRLFGVPGLAGRGELLPSAREHLSLLDAVVRGDVHAAEDLMRHHLQHVRGIWAAETAPDHRGPDTDP
jgi:DNA-binding GntR family transcriptional regulator